MEASSKMEKEEAIKVEYKYSSPAPLIDFKELRLWSFYRAIIAEFVAMLLFLYITIATVIGGHVDSPCGGVGVLGIAWAFGGMMFVLVYCTAGISGGHINPAVTFGLFLARKVSLNRAITYMAAQCCGAVCGVGMVKAIHKSYYISGGGGANAVSHDYSNGTALTAEAIGTFLIVITVFSATDAKLNATNPHILVLYPLSIGFVVFLVHLATIPITGTDINPAWSFGASVVYGHKQSWDDHWMFWVGPFVGAAGGVVWHHCIIQTTPFKSMSS